MRSVGVGALLLIGTALEYIPFMNARISLDSSLDSSSSLFTAAQRRDLSRTLSVEEGVGFLLPDLKRRSLQLCRNSESADDLVQDTVERALRFKETFQPGGHLRAWLFRIMQNVFISQKRRSSTERRIVEGAGIDPNGWATLEPSQIVPGLSPPVERALDELPERLRAVIALVDLEEGSYRDAAENQNVPIGTIMSRLHRGRARLAHSLSEAEAA
jgi:RNA polymerase sigma-70 factor (ECF subfamily)